MNHGWTLLGIALSLGTQAQAGTYLTAQVYDGTTWTDHATLNVTTAAGREVPIRYLVSTDNAQAAAFAGINFQPWISRWTNGDLVDLGHTTGTSSGNPSAGADSDFATGGEYGRVAAFAFPNIRPSFALRPYSQFRSGMNMLRIAQSGVYNWPGEGGGLDNVNGSGGVPLAQLVGGPGRLNGSPDIVTGRTNIVVYGFKLTLSSVSNDRNTVDPTRDVEISGSVFGADGVGRWFSAADLAAGVSAASLEENSASLVTSAFIDIVPGPGGIGFAFAGAIIVARRRR